MMNNEQKDNLYLAGGIMYIQPYLKDGTLGDQKYDMGATEVTLTKDTQSVSAFTRAGGLKQKIAQVVTEESYTIKITSNSFSPANLEYALGAKLEKITIQKGELLPDNEIAQKSTNFIKIEAGRNPIIKAKLIFVGTPVQGKKVVAIIHEADIKMSGDLSLMSEDFASLSFEGSANKTAQGYYTHWIELESPQEQEETLEVEKVESKEVVEVEEVEEQTESQEESKEQEEVEQSK